jgi:hypothetical protein
MRDRAASETPPAPQGMIRPAMRTRPEGNVTMKKVGKRPHDQRTPIWGPSLPFAGFRRALRDWIQGTRQHEATRELIGRQLAREVRRQATVTSLADVEFRVHSQFGDDGIIQWLVAQLPGIPPRFIEFGVEDYTEANTRFLLVNDNWSGLVLDPSPALVRASHCRAEFWRHDLTAIQLFLTTDNVDKVLADWADGQPVGLLSIDVDGNDYWLWEAITSIHPVIVIVEYNAYFGPDRAISTPYDPDMHRFKHHHSGQHFGASLAALAHLGRQKGYSLIGTNSAGINAYFVRTDWLPSSLTAREAAEAFTDAKVRDSRDPSGRLERLPRATVRGLITGLPVVDVTTGERQPL